MTPGSPEDAVPPSAAANKAMADAFADLARLVRAHPHLPAMTYVTFSPGYQPPHLDLWVARPEDVTAWARSLGGDVAESEGADDGESFTTTEAILTELETARVRLVHLAYHDKRPAD